VPRGHGVHMSAAGLTEPAASRVKTQVVHALTCENAPQMPETPFASRYSSRPGCSGQVAASWTRSAIWTRLVRLSLVSSRDTWALTVARLM
jgi:hypothetical protein